MYRDSVLNKGALLLSTSFQSRWSIDHTWKTSGSSGAGEQRPCKPGALVQCLHWELNKQSGKPDQCFGLAPWGRGLRERFVKTPE